MVLSRDSILSAADLPIERIDVPEWGGEVCVRGFTAYERDRFEAQLFSESGERKKLADAMRNTRARIACLCICDEEGKRVFRDEDVEALSKKSGKVLDRIYAVASRLSGMSRSDVEELSKNSVPGKSGDSPSDSPGSSES